MWRAGLPFPERVGVVLCLKLSNMEVQCEGIVRVMHPGLGMGIVFASHTQEQRDQVHRFIDFLSSRPGTAPELQVLPGTAGMVAVDEDNMSRMDRVSLKIPCSSFCATMRI